MQKSVYRKGLVLGIIVLFIGIAIAPGITAVDNDIEERNETIYNSEIGTSDDYKEIITFVRGEGHEKWIFRRGIFRGSLQIGFCGRCKGVELSGLRRSNGSIERYYHKVVPGEGGIKIPIFIGIVIPLSILGIAIGNIEYGMG